MSRFGSWKSSAKRSSTSYRHRTGVVAVRMPPTVSVVNQLHCFQGAKRMRGSSGMSTVGAPTHNPGRSFLTYSLRRRPAPCRPGDFQGWHKLRERADDYFESSSEFSRHEFSQPISWSTPTRRRGRSLGGLALAHHDRTLEWRFGRGEDKYRRIDSRWKFQRMTMWSDSVRRGEFVDR